MRLPRLFAVLVLLLGTAVAFAADVPIAGLKLIVIDTGGNGTAKTVFVAKDVAITKGTSTDPTQIEATFEIAYDSASGAYRMPQGGKWTGNKPTAAKYANRTAPTDGVVKAGLIKPGSLLKLVGKGLGDTPLDISNPPGGDVYVAATIVNGGETTRLCTRFSGCVHKRIAGGSGYKLLCKGNSSGDPSCTGAMDPCPTAPLAPVGGSYGTCSTDIPSGQTCALACANGYTHEGSDPVCSDGAFVGDATCTPASCAALDTPLISSDCGIGATGDTCTVQCAAGAHRSDGEAETSVSATCTGVAPGSSEWTHPTFTCTADPCPAAPPAPVGGSYSTCTTDIPSGQTCALTCANGYTHVGTDPTCESGSFVGVATCEAAACTPLAEPNVNSDCATGAIGSSCTLHCAPGYRRSDGGAGTSVGATCTGTAPGVSTWTHATFTCEPLPCEHAIEPVPAGGSYPSCTPPVSSGQSCPLVCAAGYSHDGGADPTCFLGAYSGGGATCVAASCAPLAEPYVSSTCGAGTTGSACTLQCASGSHRTDGGMGSSVSGTCTGVGPGASTWTHPTFTCAPDPCSSAPVAPVGGSYPNCAAPPIASGTTCALACANGYSVSGSNPACSSGSYNGNTPSCVPASCAPLNEPGIRPLCGTATTGDTCTVRCAPGYHRTDGGVGISVTGTCTGTAPGASAWTHPTFTCEPDPCTAPLSSVVGGSYPSCAPPVPSGQTCPLACANGYSHNGGTDPTCFLGAYSGNNATCVPATCAPLAAEPHVVSNCGTGSTGGTCTVQCDASYVRTDGGTGTSVTGTCTATGPGTSVWTHPTFTCGPPPCRVAPAPVAHGSFPTCATPPVASGTDCPLACESGYTPVGDHVTCYLGSYNGTAICMPDMAMLGTDDGTLSQLAAPAGVVTLDGAVGVNAAALWTAAIAAVQMIRRWRRR